MNQKSTVIVTVALGLVICSSLFPPLRSTSNDRYYCTGRGSLVFRSSNEIRNFNGSSGQIDVPRLVVEWVRILALAGIALAVANVKPTPSVQGTGDTQSMR
jgi:hypothetical protein